MSKLLDDWEKEEKEEEMIRNGMRYSSEYGWRNEKWLAKKEKKKNKITTLTEGTLKSITNISKEGKVYGYKEDGEFGFQEIENVKEELLTDYYEKQNNEVLEQYEKKKDPKYAYGGTHYGYGGKYLLGDEDIYGSYDYGFGRKVTGGESIMKEYEKTGEWKGYNYYKKATIDYKYIEQMANAFSAQHNIKISIGRNWMINIKEKEMMYNPTTLMYGTKADVIVGLLHEIGHLRHTTPPEEIKYGEIGKKYPNASFEVLNCLEDIRIDELMINSYEGAKDVYEANKKIVEKIAEEYTEKAKRIRARAVQETQKVPSFANMTEEELQETCKTYELDYTKIKLLLGAGHKEMVDNVLKLSIKKAEEANLFDYLGGIILKAYGHKDEKIPENVRTFVKETESSIKVIKELKSTQEVTDHLEKEIFPKIEELLKTKEEGSKEDQEIFGKQTARYIQTGGQTPEEKHKVRLNPGDTEIPSEWSNGDYTSLKNSVDSAIKELTRKLRNIKAKDISIKWKQNQKRGKLDIKNVYKYPSERYNIFKTKEKTIDRTKNFSFSIVVDTSGSMSGEKIINATRGAIILAEVFKNLEMPFEIMTFDTNANTIKSFEDKYDNKKKETIGGMVFADGGSTQLKRALDATKITTRTEKNKYMIILTDGYTSEPCECQKIIQDWTKKTGLTTIGLDLEKDSSQLKSIIGENTKTIEEANQIPIEFENIIKQIIKKLK